MEEALRQRLTTLPAGITIHVNDICTEHIPPNPIYPHHDKPECCHRLILVALGNDDQLLFTGGIEVYEYNDAQASIPRVIYLSKVDSTGDGREYGVCRHLVQAYVESQPTCRIHIFGRAQPQYLFAKSSKHPNKKLLPGTKLTAWWLRTLSDVPCLWSKDSTSTCWWFIPGVDDESTAQFDVGLKRQPLPDHVKWHYGYPADPEEEADSVVPRFEDDVKSRYLDHILGKAKKDTQKHMTMSTFCELLGFSEECRDGQAVMLVLNIVSSTKKVLDAPPPLLDAKTFTAFWNEFMFLDFSTTEKGRRSTLALMKHWREKLKPSHFEIHTTGKAVETPTTTTTTATATATQPPATDTAPPVHTLVARPKRKDSTLQPEARVLSADLIKRKKTTES